MSQTVRERCEDILHNTEIPVELYTAVIEGAAFMCTDPDGFVAMVDDILGYQLDWKDADDLCSIFKRS